MSSLNKCKQTAVILQGSMITLDVDGFKNFNEFPAMLDEGLMEELQEQDFYLGGHGSKVQALGALPESISSWSGGYFQNGYAGCIHHLDAYNKPQVYYAIVCLHF